jgi:hypothetical protein
MEVLKRINQEEIYVASIVRPYAQWKKMMIENA